MIFKIRYVCILSVFIVLLSGTDGLKFSFRGLMKKHLRGPYVPPNVQTPPEQWFTQKLDHYKPTDSRTWQQRYYTNDAYYRPGGPVFLMIGGEGPIGVGWMLYGNWIELAQEHGALCFQLEHRFYGKSHPTNDLSLENIAYLSSEQGLADLAYFIESMNRDRHLTGSKWIVFGGSYPGSLAAWMRLKYPHLVHGAVSSSGPLLAKADFYEYMEVVGQSLATYNDKCRQEVESATKQVTSALANGQAEYISSLFSLCQVLDPNDRNNEANFFELLADNWAYVVQYNQWDSKSGDPKARSLNIGSACNVMLQVGQDALQNYAQLNSMMMSNTGQTCLNIDYNATVNYIKDTRWGDENTMYRQWFYQTCSEFGFFQTSNSTAQPFGDKFPLSFFSQECSDVFGPNFNANFLNSAIDRSNTFYGGVDIEVDRVVFVHGSIDPWHALGVTKTVSEDAPAIYIEGTSHCADMMPTYPNDSPQLTAAREKIRTLVRGWLQ